MNIASRTVSQPVPQPVFSRRFGSGPRPVLALHCSLAHSGTWRGVAAELSEEATLTAFDLLTHGKSPDWDQQGDFQDRNVAAGLSLLSQPMDLVGHSFGATVALQMALRRPDLVRSLTLIEPVFFAAAEDVGLLRDLKEQSRPFTEALMAGDPALAARLFNRMWSSGAPKWPDLTETTRAAMVRAIEIVPACDPAVHTDRGGLLAPGGADCLAMPILLLHGSETNPVIPSVNAGLLRQLPNARVAVIQGAGHMVSISHPAEVAAALRSLWST
ncbi:alpha/beta fold hydrolase [Parasedimentitalea psychrophila]|uniref:Alpha/beta hydrolase n=1 Tax=Parasedimentitalea psychrophila TaxID=2997337 RepID=A0A9Y2P4Y2_9RHOB|nr:alpha/beta hydrolase [Parasedimentitalea psychrophila]WIY23403.1 alpha/beta hydrolase [Parasedimentitalea psychrophila]